MNITHTEQCSEDASLPLFNGMWIYSKSNKETIQIINMIGKWCLCYDNKCTCMRVSEFEASIGYHLTTQSTLDQVVTVREVGGSSRRPAVTKSTINNDVTVSEFEALLCFPSTAESAVSNDTDDKSGSPKIVFNNNILVLIISDLYLSISGHLLH